jgi:hypothetical protein
MDETAETPAVPLPGTAVLTEESYRTLENMLKSNDEADHKMAQLILNQLDIETNILDIYRLSRRYVNRMVNLRTKASRKFRDETSLYFIAYANSYSFARWLNQKNWLTTERFQKLKDDIVKEFSHRDDHKFYKLSFEIRDEYRHLDPNNELKPF